MQEHQLSEIHVDCDDDSSFDCRHLEESVVAWVGAYAVGEDDIVALVNEPVGKSPPHAGVDEKLHPPATDTAARESPATTAWA